MQCGEESHEFEAGPGCIIVIGGQDDFLLRPIGEGETPDGETDAEDPSTSSSSP